jgi:hypothetical protein
MVLLVLSVATAISLGATLRTAAIVQALRPAAPFVLTSIVLLVAAFWRVRACRGGRPLELHIITYATIFLVALLLGLGPRVIAYGTDLGPGIFQSPYIPVFSVIRASGRFALLMGFAASVLAGFAVAALRRRFAGRAGGGIMAALVGIVFIDVWWFDRLPTATARMARSHPAYEWLRDSAEPGAVIEYPTKQNRFAVYGGLHHRRRIVNGLGITRPREHDAIRHMSQDLSRRQVAALRRDMHPRFIVVRTDLYDEDLRATVLRRIAEQPDALKVRATFGQSLVLELLQRERADVVVRRWPGNALHGRKGFEIEASSTSGRPGTESRIIVEVNSKRALTIQGKIVEKGFRQLVPLDPAVIQRVANEIRISADYVFAGAPANPIGQTGVSLPADVEVVAQRAGSYVRVNGLTVSGTKGYRLVVLDPESAAITEIASFNTSWRVEDSDALAAMIERLPPGTPVVVASEYDVSRRLNDHAITALRKLGIRGDLRNHWGGAHAAIGVKGAEPGTAAELVDKRHSVLRLGTPERREVQLERFELQ